MFLPSLDRQPIRIIFVSDKCSLISMFQMYQTFGSFI
jgi:hypothetical protein